MVRGAALSLTKVGFRRDVKMFLGFLVAFFVTIAAFLLLLLQNNLERTRGAISATENLAADVATSQIHKIEGSSGQAEFESTALSLRTRLPIDAIEIRLDDGRVRRSGDIGSGLEAVSRKIAGGTATYYFDSSALEAMRWRFNLVAITILIAVMCAIALFFFYVPQILRPIESMLEEARELGHTEPPADEASYLIQTFRDSIATLKMQEAELQRLNEIEKNRADELQTITSTLTRSLGSGFIALNPEGRVVEMNNAAQEIIEVTGKIAPADSIADIFRDPTGTELARLIAAREAILRREFDIRLERGQTKTIGLTTVCLYTAADRFLGTLVLFTDLTQVRRLEARVRELQSLADLGVMSAAIAHEFRNSLSTVLGLLKLARRSSLPGEVDAKLAAAERETRELAEAVTGLLRFARPMQLQLAEVDLRELIESIVDRLREMTRAGFAIDGPHLRIRGDATLLSRAFENVIRNAIDATAETAQPSIEISISDGAEPSIEIRDNGSGISTDQVGDFFLPFHTTKPNGVGMGLPLARKIFLLHGGSITIAPRPEGGAIVRVELLDSARPPEQIGQQISA